MKVSVGKIEGAVAYLLKGKVKAECKEQLVKTFSEIDTVRHDRQYFDSKVKCCASPCDKLSESTAGYSAVRFASIGDKQFDSMVVVDFASTGQLVTCCFRLMGHIELTFIMTDLFSNSPYTKKDKQPEGGNLLKAQVSL